MKLRDRRHGDRRHPRLGSKPAVSEFPPSSVHTPAGTLREVNAVHSELESVEKSPEAVAMEVIC